MPQMQKGMRWDERQIKWVENGVGKRWQPNV